MLVDDAPYVGPRPFERADHDVFFGRRRETHEVRDLMLSSPALLVIGQSGTGKTSLLQAGILPTLRDDEALVMPIARVTQVRPVSLEAQTDNVHAAAVLASWAGESPEHRVPGQTLARFLAQLPLHVDRFGSPITRVAIIDQFEELFTAYPGHWQHRADFFDQLRDALDANPELRVVLAMREEHLAAFEAHEHLLDDFLRSRYRLEPLRRDGALEAVRRPAETRGRRYTEGVAELLVDDLLSVKVQDERGETREVPGEFIEAVQLQVACRSLWTHLPAGATAISADDLRRFGDVDTILATFYTDVVRAVADECSVPEPRIREFIQTALITEVGTRGFVCRSRSATAGLPNEVLDLLELHHLIRSELRAGARWYELTHDRMIAPVEASNREFAEASLSEPVRPGEGSETAAVLIARAERALSAGQFDKAEQEVATAVKLFETAGDQWAAANALAFIGDIRYANEDYDGTVSAWEQAAGRFETVGDDRALARIMLAMGRLDQDHDDMDRALAYYDEAIRLDPSADAYSARGSVNWYQGRSTEAEMDFTRALSLDANQFGARNGRGQLRADSGRAAEALADLDIALRMAPEPASRAYARSARAYALDLLDRRDEADREMQRALEATPGNAWAHLRRARMDLRRGDPAAAASRLRTALTATDPPLTAPLRELANRLLEELGTGSSAALDDCLD